MAEHVVDEISDDLDIVSAGKLYQGPWEKKYWSSSRGKDRHPYPVGYVALRTYNGNTYKMAILEGLKGPEFAISSTDGQSCSGQTPDIAWEGFSKKSCVRIKFWRGKRFSCKIDGAELFGFKNPLVARLLRGLKSNASPVVDQSLTRTHEHHTQGTLHSSEICKEPDLQVKLVKSKTEGKEKKSKKRKEVHVKSVSGTQHKKERPQEVSQMLDNVDLYAPDTMDPALEDEKGGPQAKRDSQKLDDVDLCAPDTLDPALDNNTCNSEVEILKESSFFTNDKLNGVSEKCVTESQSKDDTVIATGSENSYNCDSDSVGHEITKSMMTLLLPRALPLLKTYSRKKKKNLDEMSQKERKGTNQCLKDEVHIQNKLLTENIKIEKQNGDVILPGLEDSGAMAPDSFENQQCELMECSQVGQVNVRFDQNTCGVDLCNIEGDNVRCDVQPSEEVWDVGETSSKMKSNQDVDLVLEKSPQRGGKIVNTWKDLELTDVKFSPCHIEGTATTVDAKSTNTLTLISTHNEITKMVHNNEKVKDESTLNKSHNDELQNVFELVGCYMHPTPISMVMLRTKGNDVFICVLSGYLMEQDRTLFLYKTSTKGERKGHPSFIGHTKIISPDTKNTSADQVMQFSPDGKCLVLLNNIKAPYCREGGVKCQISACTPDSLEKNAVKIVQVKIGHVHVVCKLKTINNVCFILVCEPTYLIAAEESGRINLWTMNSTWTAATGHSYLPTSDSMPNSITEMKRIPKFPALVVGHTAFGEYCLWDLKRKILVSKFSAPETSLVPFIPINLFRCPKGICSKKQAVDMIDEIQRSSFETDFKEENLSLVLLVSSVSNPGCWSLALLAKSKLISLIALDPSATVAGASAGYGIIGTSDGSLYIWELSTGTNLGYLTHCKGATVSCLAADDSDSGAFAVAVDGTQLQVYAPGILPDKNHD